VANNETNVSSASRQVPDQPHDHGEAAEDGHRHHHFTFG
jgi:hypothetical protein